MALSTLTIPSIFETVFKYLLETHGARVPYIVMGFLEKQINHSLNCSFYGFYSAWRNISDRISKIILKFERQIAEKAGVELKELETACRGRFGNSEQIFIA